MRENMQYFVYTLPYLLLALTSSLALVHPPLVALVTYIGTYICIRIFPTYREKEFAGSRSFFFIEGRYGKAFTFSF